MPHDFNMKIIDYQYELHDFKGLMTFCPTRIKNNLHIIVIFCYNQTEMCK